MKTNAFSKFVTISAMLAGAIVQSDGVQAQTPSTINFKLLRGYVIVIPVTINNKGPYQFLLDTGSNTSIVSSEFARAQRLQPVDRIELVTTTGSQIVPRARLERLTIGDRSVDGPEVLISDLREIRQVEPGIQGVLGQNVLTQFNYLLDYAARQIVIEEDGAFEKRFCGERTPIELLDGRLLAPAQNGRRLLIDSGIPTLFLFQDGLKLDLVREDSLALTARTDLGSRQVQQRRLRNFRLGRIRFPELPVILLQNKTAADGRIEDGLLPTSLFRQIYFNHQKRFVIFNPT